MGVELLAELRLCLRLGLLPGLLAELRLCLRLGLLPGLILVPLYLYLLVKLRLALLLVLLPKLGLSLLGELLTELLIDLRSSLLLKSCVLRLRELLGRLLRGILCLLLMLELLHTAICLVVWMRLLVNLGLSALGGRGHLRVLLGLVEPLRRLVH